MYIQQVHLLYAHMHPAWATECNAAGRLLSFLAQAEAMFCSTIYV